MLTVHFAVSENKEHHKFLVLKELQSDFRRKNQPEKHFWHNREIISEAFDDSHAVVVCNEKDQLIGWMIWSLYEGGAEIDIVEVKKEHRQKGIFLMMLSALTEKFPHLIVLSAQVLLESRPVFEHLGWQAIPAHYGVTFFKTLCPCLSPLKDLPDGLAIAVCSEDYYQVQSAPNDYLTNMRYFKIDLNTAGNLVEPIVIPCNRDGYIGIYKDKLLVRESKPKNLEGTVSDHSGLLIISHIAPQILAECDRQSPPLKRSREESIDSSSAPSLKKPRSIFDTEEKKLEDCLNFREELPTLQSSSCLWQPGQLPLSDASKEEEDSSDKIDGVTAENFAI